MRQATAPTPQPMAAHRLHHLMQAEAGIHRADESVRGGIPFGARCEYSHAERKIPACRNVSLAPVSALQTRLPASECE